MKADKIVVAKPEKAPEVPDTKEDLLRQIGEIIEKVDARMAARREHSISFSGRSWASDYMRAESEAAWKLSQRLNKVINPTGDQTLPGSPEAIMAAFGSAPGTVPSWARPGTFLLWIDYMPCRCIWGGFFDPCSDVVAADPKATWMSPAGSVSVAREIMGDDRTPADLFRHGLIRKTTEITWANRRGRRNYTDQGEPAFQLHALGELAKEAAEKTLALPENAWLVEALKRGPVAPIPLPPHLQVVQNSVFA
jgi:hypothetical protein